jgi:hypothetical protein
VSGLQVFHEKLAALETTIRRIHTVHGTPARSEYQGVVRDDKKQPLSSAGTRAAMQSSPEALSGTAPLSTTAATRPHPFAGDFHAEASSQQPTAFQSSSGDALQASEATPKSIWRVFHERYVLRPLTWLRSVAGREQ